MRVSVFAVVLLAARLAGAEEPADFAAANKSLAEKSYTRACDGFAGFLKSAGVASPLAREAQAKKAWACSRVGKGGWDELLQVRHPGREGLRAGLGGRRALGRGQHGGAAGRAAARAGRR